ncbi:MAG: metal ABC transporter permease, partial [Acidimicrobiales bacterium]
MTFLPATLSGTSGLVASVSLSEYLRLPFAQHALVAAGLVAIVCGLVGPFVVARQMAFAVHGT